MSETTSYPGSVASDASAAPLLGALVVLYQPTRQHLAHLIKLRGHGVPLLVVDNSPAESAAIIEALEAQDIEYLWNANRGGIAGAYNRGLTRLFERGCCAVALFDQDSQVSADYFRVMLESCAALGPRAFAIGPRIYDENLGRFLPQIYSNGFWIRTVMCEARTSLQPCSFLLSSGCVISYRAYQCLGAFAEALFIDHVDTEYSLRALLRGVQFYVEPRLTLSHRIGEKRQHRLGPIRLTSMNHPAFRRYYMARNGMHLCIQYIPSLPIAFVPNLVTLLQVFQILLFESGKLAKLFGIGCGMVDGLFGRLGPLEAVRPRLAARLARG
ncbi:glycosyltransferase family 2 protein [Paraburkholderia sp. MMS20-SJTN17]|uniref:Glycosyltransferase family 2 protein n=1 Tax=Paraburkholderia translucens TaxID=2886945 RepID=A0ABS8KH57_9BURK|nr:glycosyltransferase family 2 protein [Paraburkholderia sp. MMS20-SJTN17]MCC8404118.1 glycosyltransferase family 2 protein [Paraburkholderia sp. MMS20-SJTN17]